MHVCIHCSWFVFAFSHKKSLIIMMQHQHLWCHSLPHYTAEQTNYQGRKGAMLSLLLNWEVKALPHSSLWVLPRWDMPPGLSGPLCGKTHTTPFRFTSLAPSGVLTSLLHFTHTLEYTHSRRDRVQESPGYSSSVDIQYHTITKSLGNRTCY